MCLIKPPALRAGDTVGIVSPSWFGGEEFLHRARRGIATLQSLGYKARIAPHAFDNAGHVSAPASKRAADLHAMFADPDIRMILCTIGGTHASELLPFLDYELIRANPKIFMGFSDITVLHNAIRSEAGLVTFYGPALLTDWAEYPQMPGFSKDFALRALVSRNPIGELSAAEWWTDEFLDWTTRADESRPRHTYPGQSRLWIRDGQGSGPLVGGCLESLQHLRGTRWWPDLDGSVLFIETSEECSSPESADAMLIDYANMGVFDRIAGLLVARPYGFDAEQRARFVDLLTRRVAPFSFPVVANLDFGHTTPQMTIPMGVRMEIDSTRQSIAVTESAVAEP